MKTRKFIGGIVDFLDVMDSAIAVSAAYRNRQRAHRDDLQRLGIDPERFAEIQRY